ncbi:dolichol-phosphate mannosyltransferase subunit 1 [Haematococcus lacustris]|uniref:dolichyl-phosphate beta-D-mannosyltransferase n=1 Tax=Haematococcus lacustris TaxID=44745 RepID=A0A699YGJ2_HAELA|nr:dolichol-phosphate mannosyltransferase subunit 1 [Haematococcus lacustris]
MHLSVIIPTYNERDNIVLLLWLLREYLKDQPGPDGRQLVWEVVVVDDGSPDARSSVWAAHMALAATGCDIVSGTRYAPGGGVAGWTLMRKVISRGANLLASTLLGAQTSDLTGAFRLYRRPVLQRLLEQCTCRLYGTSKLGAGEFLGFIRGLGHPGCLQTCPVRQAAATRSGTSLVLIALSWQDTAAVYVFT